MAAVSDQQNRPNFGSELRAARLAAGWRHAAELAGTVGVGEQTVNRWERGERRPQRSIRPDLAEALRLTLEDLDDILGTHTRRMTRSRTTRPATNVVALRQPIAGSDPEQTVEAQRVQREPDLLSAEALPALREEFVRSAIAALRSGDAANPYWSHTAYGTARLLGVPWPPLPPVES